MSDQTNTLELLAALVAGDRWLNAEQCAAHLGMFTKKGDLNVRGFHERIKCRPDFPKENRATHSWLKSEVDDWSRDMARSQAA